MNCEKITVKNDCVDTIQSLEGQYEEVGLQTCSEDW